MQAAARFDSRQWIGEVDVPTEVVVTTRDVMILPWRQRRLRKEITGATERELRAGHLAPLTHGDEFTLAIVDACESVESSRRGSVDS
jgi:3-oxoadipate enol-lactonase